MGWREAQPCLPVTLGTLVQIIVAVVILYYASKYLKPAPKPRPARKLTTSPSEKGTGKVINCLNPATGEKLGEVKALTKEDVEVCVKAARVAQQEWAKTSFEERSQVLLDLIDVVLKNEEQICAHSMADTGKTRFEAEFGEILTSCEKLRYLAKQGPAILSPETRVPPLLLAMTKKARIEYHPLGVIGVIIPWNYPFHNILSAAASAIYAGNAALVKASEWSTNSKGFYEGLLRQALCNRGHNPDLIQILPGFGDTGEALVRGGVDKVLFIGSPATGKRVMHAAADSLTPVILELGGKDPMIIFDDVSIEFALSIAMRGVFINNGQNCISAERLYVHEKVFDAFSKALAAKVNETRQGPSTKGHFDFGAMTMPAQVKIVDTLVTDAVSCGAKVLAGGKRNAQHPDGHFYEPTVLSNVKHDMRIVNEEVFGPVALLIKFSDEAELVKNVNSTLYGLGCSILSSDLTRAERLIKQIESGMITVNDYGVSYLVQALPFGGVKHSGFGRFNGPEGLRGFCRELSVVTDRFPGMKTPVPRLIQYPVSDIAPSIISTAIHAIYERQWIPSLTYMWQLLLLGIKNPRQFVGTT